MPLQKHRPQFSASKQPPGLTFDKDKSRRRTLQTVNDLFPSGPAPPEGSSGPSNNGGTSSSRYLKRHSIGGGSSSGSSRLHPSSSASDLSSNNVPSTASSQAGSNGRHRRSKLKSIQEGSQAENDVLLYEQQGYPRQLPPQHHIASQHVMNAYPPNIAMNMAPQGFMNPHIPMHQGMRNQSSSRTSSHKSNKAKSEPNKRQNGHGRGLSIGSPAELPSMSPMPLSVPNPAHIRSRGSQQQLLLNSRSMTSKPTETRSINSQTSGGPEKNVNGRKRQSTSGNVQKDEGRGRAARPRSTPIDPNAAAKAIHHPMPQAKPQKAGFSLFPPASPVDVRHNRASWSAQRTPSWGGGENGPLSAVRSPSAHSYQTAQTSRSQGNEKSRHQSPPARHRRSSTRSQGVSKENLAALAALTGQGAVSNYAADQNQAFLTAQYGIAIGGSHATSSRPNSISLTPGANPRYSGSAVSHHTGHTDGSQRRSNNLGVYSNRMSGSQRQSWNSHTGQEMTPEVVRLLREKEKLVRWKAEREKEEFERKQREKIAARVKRANELEMARSQEMEKEEKRKKKEKNRGCCGFLGG